MNFPVLLATGLIPLVIGFLWYNDSFGFGKAWMAEIGATAEDLQKNFNPIKIFGLTYLFGVFLAVALLPMVIHQMGLSSMLVGSTYEDANTEVGQAFKYLMDNYGTNYRTFKHGAFHGIISSIFLVLPVLGIGALFERRTWRYIAIHLGYWVITLGLMGGVVCAWGM